jgi:hypothetical protein
MCPVRNVTYVSGRSPTRRFPNRRFRAPRSNAVLGRDCAGPHALSIAKCEGADMRPPLQFFGVGLIAVVAVPVLQRVAVVIAV